MQPPSGRSFGGLTLGRPSRARVVLACLLLLAGCGDDAATDVEPDPGPTIPAGGLGEGRYPVADLTVRYINPDVALDLTYRISCQGDTAAVTGDDVGVDEIEACTALSREAVALRLLDGPPPGQACTQIYGGADLARLTGTIDDRSVDTEVGRENGCAIAEWDSLLADLLPVPVGATPAPTKSDATSPTTSLADGSAAAIATAKEYIDAVARGDLVLAWSFVP